MTKVIDRKNRLAEDAKVLTGKEARSLSKFVNTGGHYRSGLTEDGDGNVVIPSSIVNTAEDLSAHKFQLKNYVNVVPVTNGMGSYIVADPNQVAQTKEQLDKYPDLNSDLQSINWKCRTYAGRLSISTETLEDTNMNLTSLLSRQLGTIMINTQNKAIADEMAKVPATNVSNLDDLINAIETVDPRFQSNIFMDQKTYAKVRTFKDKNGDYLINDNTNTLLNIPIVVLPNYTGLTGIYIGSLGTALTYFDRLQTSLQYNRASVYGSALCALLRFDCKLTYPGALKHLVLSDGATK